MNNSNTPCWADFSEDLLYPHRCLANMTKIMINNKMGIPPEISDMGVVLEALNELAEIKLNSFFVRDASPQSGSPVGEASEPL